MTSGIYPRTGEAWANNGGFRRLHTRCLLTPEQVKEARSMREQGALIKVICYKFNVGRALITRALNGTGAYEGY